MGLLLPTSDCLLQLLFFRVVRNYFLVERRHYQNVFEYVFIFLIHICFRISLA
jgi:hypothetical protein